MEDENLSPGRSAPGPAMVPAQPLWRLAPARDRDGRGLADFMMLIPGLGDRPALYRKRVERAVREVCGSFGEQVVFADLNHAINVLWISVDAAPGLAGHVARAIREQVPEALLIGGHLGVAATLPATRPSGSVLWRGLRRRVVRLIALPRR